MEFAGYIEFRGDRENKPDLELDCRNWRETLTRIWLLVRWGEMQGHEMDWL